MDAKPPRTYAVTRFLFLRLLGLVYFFAFLSLSTQILGLVGSHGIFPAGETMQSVEEFYGANRYTEFPTLAWLDSSDAFLQFLCAGGVILSVLLIINVAPIPILALLWIFYFSLSLIGRDFLGFQWDSLLLETGFLAIFFAPLQPLPRFPRRDPPRIVLWLFWLLLFRLMFSSGIIKILSNDLTWANLTALTFHYETQPLPTPLAWYAHQLPEWIHKLSTFGTFIIELGFPFLIFIPFRWPRLLAAGGFITLQILIMLTGNYTFFNLLTVALAILLLDDAVWKRIYPRFALISSDVAPQIPSRKWLVYVPLVIFLVIVHFTWLGRMFITMPAPAVDVMRFASKYQLSSPYGLFAVMTTTRPDIIIEGSDDGETWKVYEFKYKVGDVTRAPPWVWPHQPRLDWQMWFAALGNYQQNRWFGNFMQRLLEGSPEVLALLETNPFPDSPPRFVRATLYDYHFTDSTERNATGTWWKREELGAYSPVLSLPDNEN